MKEPYIIAEVGSNFDHENALKSCCEAISKAKTSGADAVKFQMFDWKCMYGRTIDPVVMSAYNKKSIRPEMLPKLKEKADACEIDFLCSTFSKEYLDAVNPFVDAHKIASSELTNSSFIKSVVRKGKPCFLSTGGSILAEVRTTIYLMEVHATFCKTKVPVTVMVCFANYPSVETNLEKIDVYRKSLSHLTSVEGIGFSDHSTDYTTIPVLGIKSFGAVVLEKHFNAFDFKTPDSPHSLNAEQFKIMVDKIKREESENMAFYGMQTGEENHFNLTARRRLIAIRDIDKGEKFILDENFGAYRSLTPEAKGMHAALADCLDGELSEKPYKAGEGIFQHTDRGRKPC